MFRILSWADLYPQGENGHPAKPGVEQLADSMFRDDSSRIISAVAILQGVTHAAHSILKHLFPSRAVSAVAG